MKVRDLTKKKTDYKGHEFYAAGAFCPCRPCVNCHDCGSSCGGTYHEDFRCAKNHNDGCPQPKPEPQHILNPGGRCIRCGAYPKKFTEETYNHIGSPSTRTPSKRHRPLSKIISEIHRGLSISDDALARRFAGRRTKAVYNIAKPQEAK